MSLSPIKPIECKLVGEEEQKEVFHKLNNDARRKFLEVIKQDNTKNYLSKKRDLRSLRFEILITIGIALFKNSIGITSGIFQKYLSIQAI